MEDPKYICPGCKTEQRSVIEDRVQQIFLNVWPESKGNYSYDHDNDGDIHRSRFHCPNCDKLLAHDENELDKLFYN